MNDTVKRKDLITAVVVTVIVNIIVIVGLYFHEPWFDEAQAYLIARDSSLHDIILHWTHYEGHPPLWHLLLKCGITIGLPFETALKLLNLIFVEAVLLMIEFFSPFSRITKIMIPASFYLLYQYSVVSRPYMMLLFACLLAAVFYGKRYEKPMRYTAALLFMCLTHSYGLAFAGGIIIADMAGEAIRERSVGKMAARIIKCKKLLVCYVFLLMGALAIIAEIMPYSDTFAMNRVVASDNKGFFACYLLSWLFIPSENLVTSFSSEIMYMSEEANPISELIAAGIISLIIWTILFMICKKRRMLSEMFIPYACIAVLTSMYIKPHHFGIFIMYMLFVLWTAAEKERITLSEFTEPIKKAGMSEKMSRGIVLTAVIVFSAVNVFWNGMSYYNEIKKVYDPASSLAQWIKKYDLQDRTLLTTWEKSDPHIFNGASVASNAYFDKNIYYNMYNGLSFLSHVVCTEDVFAEEAKEISLHGAPDFMICDVPVETSYVCETLGFNEKYIAIAFTGVGDRIFKDKTDKTDIYVMCTAETYRELYGKDYEVQTYKNS
ncbi:MAG: hypothetical protein K6G33_04180 [Ruminococcus sp.]|uniref:hypothetical protein n=1 Tax=Ruminococcus sp. TaxID=41978 RepID=UPI0025D5358D|nr:hypothetical protein [Ruminococcus sp.]MCR5599926.1 hypothetical protein [Ruminococcus sp.]